MTVSLGVKETQRKVYSETRLRALLGRVSRRTPDGIEGGGGGGEEEEEVLENGGCATMFGRFLGTSFVAMAGVAIIGIALSFSRGIADDPRAGDNGWTDSLRVDVTETNAHNDSSLER